MRTKTFDGKEYEYQQDCDTKKEAKELAASLRADGLRARISPSIDWGMEERQWSVWKRRP